MKILYIVLSIAGAIVPYTVFVPWLMAHGLDLAQLHHDIFASRVSAFFCLDVVMSELTVLVLVGRALNRGVPGVWLAAVASIAFGVASGLPLLMFFEARHKEQSRLD